MTLDWKIVPSSLIARVAGPEIVSNTRVSTIGRPPVSVWWIRATSVTVMLGSESKPNLYCKLDTEVYPIVRATNRDPRKTSVIGTRVAGE